MKHCGYCGKQIDEKVKFCPYCGRQVGQGRAKQVPPAATKFCGHCGAAMPATAKFCPRCGGKAASGEGSRQNMPPKPKKRHWIAAIAAVLVVCLGVGGFWLIGDGDIARFSSKLMPQEQESIVSDGGSYYIDENLYYVSPTPDRLHRTEYNSASYIEGEILVCYPNVITKEFATQKAREYGAELTGFIGSTGLSQWHFPGDISQGELEIQVETLKADPDVSYAMLNYAYDDMGSISAFDGVDLKDRAKDNSSAEKTMGFPQGWALFEYMVSQRAPDKPVNVGVIDVQFADGVNSDLQAMVFSETSNLTADELRTHINIAQTELGKNQFRHGTHVAGIIGATYRNGEGIDGAYPLAYDRRTGEKHLYAISAKSTTMGFCVLFDLLFRHDAKVINYSMGDKSSEEIENRNERDEYEQIINEGAKGIGDYLQKKLAPDENGSTRDFLIVTAAGNEIGKYDSKTLDCKYSNIFTAITQSEYPDVYKRIIVVGNSKTNGKLFKTSYGGNRMDIMAVGVDIWSTIPDAKLGKLSGTSMAAPYVAGAAAMAWTLAPDWKGDELKDNIISLSMQKRDGKMLDVYALITKAAQDYSDSYADESVVMPIPPTPMPNPPHNVQPTEEIIPAQKPSVPEEPIITDVPSSEPKASIDYTSIFQKQIDEMVAEYGALPAEAQVKEGAGSKYLQFLWTGGETEGMLFGDIFDYDMDGAPELLTCRNLVKDSGAYGDDRARDNLYLEIFEAEADGCRLADSKVVLPEALSLGCAGTAVSIFRYENNGAPAVGVMCETDSGVDWIIDVLSYGYSGEALSLGGGVAWGEWPGAYAEDEGDEGYLSTCMEASSEESALHTSANGDTFDYWRVVANSGRNFSDPEVFSAYGKCLAKLGLSVREGSALWEQLTGSGRYGGTYDANDPYQEFHIRYRNATDSFEAASGSLTQLGNLTSEYFFDAQLYFAKDYLYKDMQEFIATGNLTNGSNGKEVQLSPSKLLPNTPPSMLTLVTQAPAATKKPKATKKPGASGDDSEDALRRKVLEAYKGSGDIQAFGYSDYDWDGRHEAFALIGVYDSDAMHNTCELWFASANGCTCLERDKGYYPDVSDITAEGGYSCFTVSEGYFGSGSKLRLWTVLDGEPVLYMQSEYAGQSGEVSREVYLSDRDSGANADSGDTGHGGTVKVREAGIRSNVRTGPGLAYDTLGELTSGMELEFLNETSIDGRGVTWYKVRFEGRDGWVSEKYTKLKTY